MNTLENLRQQIIEQHPTQQQQNAIFADELEFILRAAPGSGKTWTSCRRFIWRGANRKESIGGLALLSYTNAAIKEFQTATIEVDRRDLLSDPNYVGTFDAFVERFIITPFGHLIAGTSRRPKLFIAPSAFHLNHRKLQINVKYDDGKVVPVRAWQIVPFRSNGKTAFKIPKNLGGVTLDLVQHNPVDEFMAIGYYSHEQRVYWACQLLRKRPHIAAIVAKRFPEIIIDEAQDTNEWLIILLHYLRVQGTKVTLVGDPDQCIYEFSMAHATLLSDLKEKWNIPEKPLSKSFRCNNAIASAARFMGENEEFSGCGDAMTIHSLPFIIREPTAQCEHSIQHFKNAIQRAGIKETSSAIICRGHQQLEAIRGANNYSGFQGLTNDLARASFYRDQIKDYRKAFKIVETVIRSMVEDNALWEKIDEFPESSEAATVKLAIWRFVRTTLGLPPISLSGTNWIAQLRQTLGKLMLELGVSNIPNFVLKIRRNGLNDAQMALPLFEAQALFPSIRQEIIHQVKGESIDAVLVILRQVESGGWKRV